MTFETTIAGNGMVLYYHFGILLQNIVTIWSCFYHVSAFCPQVPQVTALISPFLPSTLLLFLALPLR